MALSPPRAYGALDASQDLRDLFGRHPLFQRVPERDLRRLLLVALPAQTFQTGEVALHLKKDEATDHVLIVLEGVFKSEGPYAKLYAMGDIIGLSELFAPPGKDGKFV